jgi:hypothetical protein
MSETEEKSAPESTATSIGKSSARPGVKDFLISTCLFGASSFTCLWLIDTLLMPHQSNPNVLGTTASPENTQLVEEAWSGLLSDEKKYLLDHNTTIKVVNFMGDAHPAEKNVFYEPTQFDIRTNVNQICAENNFNTVYVSTPNASALSASASNDQIVIAEHRVDPPNYTTAFLSDTWFSRLGEKLWGHRMEAGSNPDNLDPRNIHDCANPAAAVNEEAGHALYLNAGIKNDESFNASYWRDINDGGGADVIRSHDDLGYYVQGYPIPNVGKNEAFAQAMAFINGHPVDPEFAPNFPHVVTYAYEFQKNFSGYTGSEYALSPNRNIDTTNVVGDWQVMSDIATRHAADTLTHVAANLDFSPVLKGAVLGTMLVLSYWKFVRFAGLSLAVAEINFKEQHPNQTLKDVIVNYIRPKKTQKPDKKEDLVR